MAKYYRSRKDPYRGDLYEDYEAVAEKPETIKFRDGDDVEEHSVYPNARLTVHTTTGTTSTNWHFDKDRNWGARNFPEQAATLDKEVGVPNLEKHLSGRLGNIYETTIYSADSLKNQRDFYSKKEQRDIGIEYARGVRDLKKGSSELFSSTPPETTITAAFSHTKMRHTIPIMAAMVHQQWGNLTASDDLSPHSSRMVKKAKKKNLPIKTSEDNPRADITNDYTFHDSENIRWALPTPETSHLTEIPEKEVQSAKQHFREIRGLVKPQPKAIGPQFTQMQLPGMEG